MSENARAQSFVVDHESPADAMQCVVILRQLFHASLRTAPASGRNLQGDHVSRRRRGVDMVIRSSVVIRHALRRAGHGGDQVLCLSGKPGLFGRYLRQPTARVRRGFRDA